MLGATPFELVTHAFKHSCAQKLCAVGEQNAYMREYFVCMHICVRVRVRVRVHVHVHVHVLCVLYVCVRVYV